MPQDYAPPDNCPPCLVAAQKEQEHTVTPIGNGVAYRSHRFHRNDFVMYFNTGPGPANIGQIVDFVGTKGRKPPQSAIIRVFGRISDIVGICPELQKDQVCSPSCV